VNRREVNHQHAEKTEAKQKEEKNIEKRVSRNGEATQRKEKG